MASNAESGEASREERLRRRRAYDRARRQRESSEDRDARFDFSHC